MSSNRLLLQFAQRYPILLILTVVLGLSSAIFNGVSTFLVIPLIMAFLGQDMNIEGAPPILRVFTSLFDGFPEEWRIPLMTFAVIGAIFGKNATQYASAYSSALLTRFLVQDIRRKSLRILMDVDLDFFVKMRVGDLVNRLGVQVQRTGSSINTAATFTKNIFTIFVFIIALLAISWQLTLIATILLPLVWLINQYFVKRAKYFGKILSDMSRDSSAALHEMINGIRLVKSRANEDKEYKKVDYLMTERQTAQFKSQVNSAIIGPMNEFSGVLMILVIVLLGEFFLSTQVEAISAVLLNFLVFLFRMLPFIGQLNSNRSQFANLSASVDLIADLLNRDNKQFMSNGYLPVQKLQEGIRFEGVGFHYPGYERMVLQDINLFLPRGTTLALVGGSGAGKSTIADLVPRFYDVTEGRILIDGRDIREYDLRSLRRSMGIVSQDTFLFNDSVRNNIAYAAPDATDDDIIQAAKRANAYEFILDLPQGFETPLGDRGVLLSGGQRQRIAIARAILQDPEILVLDEATSALDTVSERLVQSALEDLSKERTTLVIAHRLSTIQNADQIAVLERGKVVELGSHRELLAKDGHYAHLYAMQFSSTTQHLVQNARNQSIIQFSYEVRSRLNPTIGFLNLLVDDVVDTSEERHELIESAYEASVRLLHTLETMENDARQASSSSEVTEINADGASSHPSPTSENSSAS